MIAASFALAAASFSGRDNQVHVPLPLVDAPTITVDGVLDEPSLRSRRFLPIVGTYRFGRYFLSMPAMTT